MNAMIELAASSIKQYSVGQIVKFLKDQSVVCRVSRRWRGSVSISHTWLWSALSKDKHKLLISLVAG